MIPVNHHSARTKLVIKGGLLVLTFAAGAGVVLGLRYVAREIEEALS